MSRVTYSNGDVMMTTPKNSSEWPLNNIRWNVNYVSTKGNLHFLQITDEITEESQESSTVKTSNIGELGCRQLCLAINSSLSLVSCFTQRCANRVSKGSTTKNQ